MTKSLPQHAFDGNYVYLRYFVSDIQTVFNDGVPLQNRTLDVENNRIGSVIDGTQSLDDYCKQLKETAQRYICILKVPKHYIGHLDPEGNPFPTVPLIKAIKENPETKDTSLSIKHYVTPSLVYAVYDIQTGETHKNETYNPWYNYDGHHHTEDQIEFLENLGLVDYVRWARTRLVTPYKSLETRDRKNNTFQELKSYYQKLLKPAPNKKVLD